MQAGSTHDLPGETFRLLSDQVAYLKLSSVQAAQAASYIERSKSTRGLIIDIRNYPSEFVPFALGTLFVDQPTPFARFTAGDLDNPGAFLWRGAPLMLTPQQPHYAGKVVVLVDEVTLSQSEYTTMAFRASAAPSSSAARRLEPTVTYRSSCFPVDYERRSAVSESSTRTSARRSASASFPTSRHDPRLPESAPAAMKCLKKGCDKSWAERCRPIRLRRWPRLRVEDAGLPSASALNLSQRASGLFEVLGDSYLQRAPWLLRLF